MDPSRDYPSKRDWWLTAIVWGCVAGMVVPPLLQHRAAPPVPGSVLFVVLGLAAGALFPLWVLYGTSYWFDDEWLRIRCGPFRYRVPLAHIDSVEPTRSPLSSPACSLDRLLIKHGKHRMLVSPADRAGFLAELQMRCPRAERVNC